MTLIITAIAALIASALWFANRTNDTMKFGVLALMYWGASLMWCVDGIACVLEGEPFVELVDKAAMLDDAKLGVLVVVVGLAAWAVALAASRRRSTAAA